VSLGVGRCAVREKGGMLGRSHSGYFRA
jgi:hypothetical protein